MSSITYVNFTGYMQKKNKTLKDVARVAGVSTATVARVLHNKGYIAGDTRTRVAAAIQETGYRINAVARNLRKQRTVSIGHIVTSILPNPFYAGVALGAEQEASRQGWSILMINAQDDAQRERLGVETFIQQRVDAILFTTPTSEANVRLALDAGVTVVQVERPTSLATHTVVVDNYAGTVEAVEHLIAYGHRRIAFVGGDPALYPEKFFGRYVEEERFAGYRDTLGKYSLPLDKRLIILGLYSSSNVAAPCDHYISLKPLLQSDDRPTAVIISDMQAVCLLQELYACALRIPEDISVIGFDDTYAPYFAPPLTSVQQPMLEIGKAAVRLALKHSLEEAASDHRTFEQVKLSTRLILRSSTGPVS